MPEQKTQIQQDQEPQDGQAKSAIVQTQPVTSQPPAIDALKPDKTVPVPGYFRCLAGDATLGEAEIHAVTPKKTAE